MSSLFLLSPDPQGTCCGCETRFNPCDPCTGVTTGCNCQLNVNKNGNVGQNPAGNGPFDNLTGAQSGLALSFNSCFAYAFDQQHYLATPSSYISSFSSEFDINTNKLTLNFTTDPSSAQDIFMWSSINAKAGSTLTLSYTVSLDTNIYVNSQIDFSVLDCTLGTELFTRSASFSPFSWDFIIPEDNEYVVLWRVFEQSRIVPPAPPGTVYNPAGSCTLSTNDGIMPVNPIVALYVNPDDITGTPLELEACPKLVLPLFAEVNGSWYPDLSSAQSVISSNTSDCISYFIDLSDGSIVFSFVASSPSNTINHTLSDTYDGSDGLFYEYVFSINSAKNTMLNYHFDASGTTLGLPFALQFNIYDDNWQLIEALTDDPFNLPHSNTLVSSPLPYTGKYNILFGFTCNIIFSDPGGNLSLIGALTSSDGLMTINPVQALYNVGFDCPARLDCS